MYPPNLMIGSTIESKRGTPFVVEKKIPYTYNWIVRGGPEEMAFTKFYSPNEGVQINLKSGLDAERFVLQKVDGIPCFPRLQAEFAEPCIGLAMDYLSGDNLHAVYQDRGTPLDCEAALELAGYTTAQLHLMHELGLIHRDIKLENIQLAEDVAQSLRTGSALPPSTPRSIVVVDYGSALYTQDGMPVETTFSGTPRLASPEGMDGKFSPSTDMHTWGSMMWYALTGKFPIPSSNLREYLDRLEETETKPLSRIPVCAGGMEELICESLRFGAEDRPTSLEAEEIVRKLTGIDFLKVVSSVPKDEHLPEQPQLVI